MENQQTPGGSSPTSSSRHPPSIIVTGKRAAAQRAAVALRSNSPHPAFTSGIGLPPLAPAADQGSSTSSTMAAAYFSALQQQQQGQMQQRVNINGSKQGPSAYPQSGVAILPGTSTPVVDKKRLPSQTPTVSSNSPYILPLDKQNPLLRLDEIFTTSEDPYWEAVALERELEQRIQKRQIDVADACFRVRKIKRRIQVEVTREDDNAPIEDAQVESIDAVPSSVGSKLIIETSYADEGSSRCLPAHSYIKSVIIEGVNCEDSTSNKGKVDQNGDAIEDVLNASNLFLHEIRQLTGDRTEIPIPSNLKAIQVAVILNPQPAQFKISPALKDLLSSAKSTSNQSNGATSPSVNTPAIINVPISMSRPQVIMALWQYVKLNRLQESEEKKIIRLDERMKTCFASSLAVPPSQSGGQSIMREKIMFADLPVLIQPHLMPLDPIKLDLANEGGEKDLVDQDITSINISPLNYKMAEFELDVEEKPAFSPTSGNPENNNFSQTLAQTVQIGSNSTTGSTAISGSSSSRLLSGPSYTKIMTIQRQLAEVESEHRALAEQALHTKSCIDFISKHGSNPQALGKRLASSLCGEYDLLVGQMRLGLDDLLLNDEQWFGRHKEDLEDAIEDYLAYEKQKTEAEKQATDMQVDN